MRSCWTGNIKLLDKNHSKLKWNFHNPLLPSLSSFVVVVVAVPLVRGTHPSVCEYEYITPSTHPTAQVFSTPPPHLRVCKRLYLPLFLSPAIPAIPATVPFAPARRVPSFGSFTCIALLPFNVLPTG